MNSLRNKLIASAVLFLSLFAVPAGASTPEPPAAPRDYVVDLAAVMNSDQRTRLNGVLLELEQKTTAQVLVLTVKSLDGEPIDRFAFNTKEQWKLGQKGKDNGALIAVALQDKKYRFEIGYGLEEILPDSLVGTIGREYLVPNFRKGDYSTGIYTAALAVAKTIADHDNVTLTGMPDLRSSRRRGSDYSLIYTLGFFAVIAVFSILSQLGGPGGPGSSIRRNTWGRGYYGGMGGGFGGGGFGGFGGGGGGGSFGGGGGGSGGGGGASGGW